MFYNLCWDIEGVIDGDYFGCMFWREIYFEVVFYVEYFIYFSLVGIVLFLNGFE